MQIRRDFSNPDLVTELTLTSENNPLRVMHLDKQGIRTDDEILNDLVADNGGSVSQAGMSSVSTQDTPHVDKMGENVQGTTIANESSESANLNSLPTQDQMISFESGDGVRRTHNIPNGLVNQTKSLKDAQQELSVMTTEGVEDNRYGLELLDKITQANPNIQVKLVDDLSLEDDKKIRIQLSAGGVYTPHNDTVNIYPNGDLWEGSATDLVNHELVHAVNFDIVENGLSEAQQAVVQEIKDALESYREKAWETVDPYILDRIDNAVSQDYPHEMFSTLIAESDVRQALQGSVDLSQLDGIFNDILNSRKGGINAQDSSGNNGSNAEILQENVPTAPSTGTGKVPTVPTGIESDGDNETNAGTDQDSNSTNQGGGKAASTESKPTGVITALRGVNKAVRTKERSKPFKERNLITAHFNQNANTNNPLVLVSNFIESLKGNLKEAVQKFVRNPLTGVQEKQLEDYLDFHKKVSSTIKQIFLVKPEKVRYRDYTSFLVNADNQLDENTLTALTLAAYSTFIETGLKTLNTNAEIAELLHLDKDTYIPNAVADQYRDIGQERAVVIHALGKKAVKFLGLKVRRDSDPKFQSSLEGSLGGLIYMALRTQGLVQETKVLGEQHAANISLIYEANGEDYVEPKEFGFEYAYVRTALKNGEVIPRIKDIIEKNKDTKGFLSKLFGNDVGLREPKLEQPKTFDQTTMPDTSPTVSSTQAGYIEQSQKNGFKIRVVFQKVC